MVLQEMDNTGALAHIGEQAKSMGKKSKVHGNID